MLRPVSTLKTGKEMLSCKGISFHFSVLYWPVFVHTRAEKRRCGILPWFMHRIALSLSLVYKENVMRKGQKVICSGSGVISRLWAVRIDISLISPRNSFLRKTLNDTMKVWGRVWSLGFLCRATVQLRACFLQVVYPEHQCDQGQAVMFSWDLPRPSCQGM